MEPVITLLAAVEVSDGETAIRDRQSVVADREFGDPVADARAWIDQGASWLHVADLDAAAGTGENRDLIVQVVHAVRGRAKVQLAGGVRDDASLRWALQTGADRVVLDPVALADAEWAGAAFGSHGGKVLAGLDLHRGRLWAPGSSIDGIDPQRLAAALRADGCPGFVVTDVDHEGTRKGPDTRQLRQLCGSVAAPFCVAGGIARLEHLHALAELSKVGVVAAVLDAALYRDYFNVAEAMAAAEPRYDPYQWGPAQPWGMT